MCMYQLTFKLLTAHKLTLSTSTAFTGDHSLVILTFYQKARCSCSIYSIYLLFKVHVHHWTCSNYYFCKKVTFTSTILEAWKNSSHILIFRTCWFLPVLLLRPYFPGSTTTSAYGTRKVWYFPDLEILFACLWGILVPSTEKQLTDDLP